MCEVGWSSNNKRSREQYRVLLLLLGLEDGGGYLAATRYSREMCEVGWSSNNKRSREQYRVLPLLLGLEDAGIDPAASRMLSERSTI